ncbi:MAG: TetR/AcrR family transcriptional regulator, partial [Acidobacteriota bacterium]
MTQKLQDTAYRIGWQIVEGPDQIEEQKKKECILHCAATLFADKGYAGTSVREIVEAAGVTKPTLYYYFKNKEDLYLQLMDSAMNTFFATVEESLVVSGTACDRLTALFINIWNLSRSNVELLRLVNAMVYGPRGAMPLYDLYPRHLRLEHIMANMLTGNGEIPVERIRPLMLLLFGLLRSMQSALVIDHLKDSFTPEDIAGAIRIILQGAQTEV